VGSSAIAMATRINPASISKAPAPLSHAVKVGNLVFVSGTTPFKPNVREIEPDFAGQMHQVMAKIKLILEDAGTQLGSVVKMNVILTRASDFKEMNEIYRSYFPSGEYPARTTIVAQLAVPEILLEIECIAEA
jgi:2-iminobutanoate/2-iminopropanoate deaminase